MEQRICNKCGTTRPLSDFYKNSQRTSGYDTVCAPCKRAYISAYHAARPEQRAKKELRRKQWRSDPINREYENTRQYARWKDNPENNATASRKWLLKKSGLTFETYDALLESQGGGCAICGRTTGKGPRGNMHIDHNHETGVVRGLLCTNCNTGLGNLRDSVELMEKAIAYLRSWA